MKKKSVIRISLVLSLGVVGFLVAKVTQSNQSQTGSDAELARKSYSLQKPGQEANSKHQGSGTRGSELAQNPRRGLKILSGEAQDFTGGGELPYEILANLREMMDSQSADQLATLLGQFSELDLDRSFAFMAQMVLVDVWVEKEGEAAVDRLMTMGNNPMLRSFAIDSWMSWNPGAAFQWVQKNGEKLKDLGGIFGTSKAKLESSYYRSLARRDFTGALEKLGQMSTEIQEEVVEKLAATAATDRSKREKLFAELKEKNPELLSEARINLINAMVWDDAHKAMAFIQSEEVEAKDRKNLERRAYISWVSNDPEAALKWRSQNLKENSQAGDQIAGAFGNWVEQDEKEAALWLKEQGEEFQTDSLFEQAGISLLYEEEYERSAQWYEQVLDPKERGIAYQELYEKWNESSPAEAEQWKAQLPKEDQEILDGEPLAPADKISEEELDEAIQEALIKGLQEAFSGE